MVEWDTYIARTPKLLRLSGQQKSSQCTVTCDFHLKGKRLLLRSAESINIKWAVEDNFFGTPNSNSFSKIKGVKVLEEIPIRDNVRVYYSSKQPCIIFFTVKPCS